MSELRNNEYCNIPFTTEMCKVGERVGKVVFLEQKKISKHFFISFKDDFYTYASIEDLISICAMNKEKITKIRSIGILESVNGRFFIKDVSCETKFTVNFRLTP